ncbi:MAG: hypothetical protein KAS62_10205, partial [Candidatus Delongbacteria bacterium]|nr:hypothetical protein [Candidatus Delongbacteria bacterium]
YMNSYFIQIADIDLGVSPWNENEGWDPIGNDMEPFTGFYNGDYHKISSIFIDIIDDDIWNTGLFGYIEGQITGSTIENVILDSVSINEEKNVGALAGQISYANVSNCSSAGSVIGEDIVGGLIGLVNNYSNTYGCHSTCSVTGIIGGFYGDTVGGLIGELSTESSLSDSYATGSVTGENGVGGLIGYCGNNATITNCYSTGFITVNQDYAGGLVGFGDMVNEFFSYYDMDTSGQDTSFVGTGKTYSEMHLQSTYETWDFATVWQIDPLLNYGYPYLAWSTPPVNNTPFAGGDGSEVTPYLVASPTQLDSVRNYTSSHFKQISNIDLTIYISAGNPGYNNGDLWLPIMYGQTFYGIYDGNFKIITGLKINRPASTAPCGLFSDIDSFSEIKNLYILNSGTDHVTGLVVVGAVAGYNSGSIYRCFSDIDVTGDLG